jgi:hypothetical protein
MVRYAAWKEAISAVADWRKLRHLVETVTASALIAAGAPF